jgi:hypothetical protein
VGEPDAVLVIQVGADEADEEEIAELSSQLSAELLQLDVLSVEPTTAGPAPEGSKGLPLVAVGTLLVKLLKSAPVLSSVTATLQSWLSRRPGRSIELTLDGDTLKVTDISAEDQRRLIDAWVARHAVEHAQE